MKESYRQSSPKLEPLRLRPRRSTNRLAWMITDLIHAWTNLFFLARDRKFRSDLPRARTVSGLIVSVWAVCGCHHVGASLPGSCRTSRPHHCFFERAASAVMPVACPSEMSSRWPSLCLVVPGYKRQTVLKVGSSRGLNAFWKWTFFLKNKRVFHSKEKWSYS